MTAMGPNPPQWLSLTGRAPRHSIFGIMISVYCVSSRGFTSSHASQCWDHFSFHIVSERGLMATRCRIAIIRYFQLLLCSSALSDELCMCQKIYSSSVRMRRKSMDSFVQVQREMKVHVYYHIHCRASTGKVPAHSCGVLASSRDTLYK